MLKPHLTRDSAEQYILGALSPEASATLEAHTLECEPCARLLQEEALLSEQLEEVAQAFPREDRVIRPARWHVRRVAAGAVSAALAAAASLALVLLPGGRGHHPSGDGAGVLTSPALELEVNAPQAIVVACPDLATQDSCTQKAAERGLLVQNPWGTGEVPRYEARTGLPEGALSARHPVSL
ncbi:zf-HC2 domain-containing protein [Pyxidicoccus parkwayensis]|uniref:Zf-HC2 domain-containing protein n=1 Tax=Pyxidicoccus parkwayensis TaxID=2813578 RepID=A0ABX7NLE0_9BACT|nr:zf-HC2 domain-containing protein [Pyxidicoccus parkwaysis]QSQ19682.1 zf-HC2 domain-containing protein [Pyxidicoccus parkwaysis]